MNQLLDIAQVPKRKGSTKALVRIDPRVCPACLSPLAPVRMWEPALFYFGGYGATRRSTSVHCSRLFDRHCSWALTTEVIEVNPRRAA